jgi:hypothetical protein
MHIYTHAYIYIHTCIHSYIYVYVYRNGISFAWGVRYPMTAVLWISRGMQCGRLSTCLIQLHRVCTNDDDDEMMIIVMMMMKCCPLMMMMMMMNFKEDAVWKVIYVPDPTSSGMYK